MASTPPSPGERFEIASQHAALIRALLSHPAMNLTPAGLPDRTKTHPTLYNVTDFELRTYKEYLLPILPPDAEKISPALALSQAEEVKENPDLMSDDMYPRMNVGGFGEKWRDAIGRTVMITDIILNTSRQILFGGTFDFGNEVKEKARVLD
ncbi:uncharacterized protein Z519_01552 [Cladophialophora bantiana CBS 173.52]|uniref:Uncharacterized protein n=1 Tax=Cladophialophora bantiana (strain ATCC 10958 / CBS 173.52 / CDC B-1940 / NIH 8579) TaxID=1442370 RepID=A0A0D2HX57_CLAB1|nr:uncharacterized protein Z519_01552 [Cladophialophora bantiana CBS 173.52]KIW97968.1 hypothetical protein Z519_01552 [Cladophialophora bantiana CBS 173.52]